MNAICSCAGFQVVLDLAQVIAYGSHSKIAHLDDLSGSTRPARQASFQVEFLRPMNPKRQDYLWGGPRVYVPLLPLHNQPPTFVPSFKKSQDAKWEVSVRMVMLFGWMHAPSQVRLADCLGHGTQSNSKPAM